MDVSLEYIKMCEKATEIQDLFKTTEPVNYAAMHSGHFVAHWYEEEPNGKMVSLLETSYCLDRIRWCLFRPSEGWGSHTPEKYTKIEQKFIWLPRQDQLQEMIDWSGVSYIVSTQAFKINEFYNTLKEVPSSMEQLWLAFVMKERFGKVWSGTEWHVENRS